MELKDSPVSYKVLNRPTRTDKEVIDWIEEHMSSMNTLDLERIHISVSLNKENSKDCDGYSIENPYKDKIRKIISEVIDNEERKKTL
jgi:CRISPR/Cas system CMR subunit Cmr4 (Cas7 group RAMP superfamily)